MPFCDSHILSQGGPVLVPERLHRILDLLRAGWKRGPVLHLLEEFDQQSGSDCHGEISEDSSLALQTRCLQVLDDKADDRVHLATFPISQSTTNLHHDKGGQWSVHHPEVLAKSVDGRGLRSCFGSCVFLVAIHNLVVLLFEDRACGERAQQDHTWTDAKL